MASSPLPSSFAPQRLPCKCCGSTAVLFGVVDFNKHCEQHKSREILPLCGIPIYYHRCQRCGFVFTVAFDHFSPSDFLSHIYNAGYAAIDPDYADLRPRNSAALVGQFFGNQRKTSILDYGGGNGLLERTLRESGYSDVVTYDPFVAAHSQRPQRRFDAVVAFEVVEHSNHPIETFDDIDSLLNPDGVIIFSTLLQPANFEDVGLSWWYAAPRNGHVSLYTKAALKAVLGRKGLTLGSNSENLHAAWRTAPDFAKQFVIQ